MAYKIVKISSYYRDIVADYYLRNPKISEASYQEQYSHLMEQGFGWSNYFENYLNELGNEAYGIVTNALPLQKAWAENYGYKYDNQLLINQIKYYSPDVLFFQDSTSYNANFYKNLKETIPSIKLIIGHCCCPFSEENLKAFKKLDIMLSCSPHFHAIFNQNGIKSELFYHAFEHKIIDKLNLDNNYPNTNILFIGSFVQNADFHDNRVLIIEQLLKQAVDLTIYSKINFDSFYTLKLKQLIYILTHLMKDIGLGNLALNNKILKKFITLNSIPKSLNISKEFKSRIINEALYGNEMLKALSKSKIGINVHGGIAGDYAANIRMFEVTGVGSLLVTDHKKNISDLFKVDEEIITYKSINECIEKIKFVVNHSAELSKIAQAGHLRTIRDHSIKKRAEQLDILIKANLK